MMVDVEKVDHFPAEWAPIGITERFLSTIYPKISIFSLKEPENLGILQIF